MTDNANGWLWDGWKEASRVLVPRDAFLSGDLSIATLIRTIPPPLLARMKQVLARYARRFQVSLEDDVEGDEVHLILTRAVAYAASQES